MSVESIKATIDANIKANGQQQITGVVLNKVLNEMVDAMSSGGERSLVLGVGKNGGYINFDTKFFTLNSAYDVTEPVYLRKGETLVYKTLCPPASSEVSLGQNGRSAK